MSIITTPLPYTLANGTTADANQVMADLNQIVTGVNTNTLSTVTSTANTWTADQNFASTTVEVAPATLSTHAVQLGQLYTGWIPDVNAWTYASASTFTVPGNQTGLYVPGLKIKWTDTGGVKYGVVLSSAYTSLTTVTIMVNTSYTIASGAISAPSFSFGTNPVGFPAVFAFTVTANATIPGGTPPTFSVSGSYYTIGRRIFVDIQCSVTAAGTGAGGIALSGFPVSIAVNQMSGSAKENAVIGISGVVVGGVGNTIVLQTYLGGNPIVSSYFWIISANTYF